MSKRERIAVFYSEGQDFVQVLERVRTARVEARICAILPQGYPKARLEGLADEIVESERAHYSPREVLAVWALVRRLRAERFDGFVVLFASPQLRLLASVSDVPVRWWSRPDGLFVRLEDSLLAICWDVACRAVRGRLTYAKVWLWVHLARVRAR